MVGSAIFRSRSFVSVCARATFIHLDTRQRKWNDSCKRVIYLLLSSSMNRSYCTMFVSPWVRRTKMFLRYHWWESHCFSLHLEIEWLCRKMKNNDLVCHNCRAFDHRSYSLPDASCFFLDSSNVNLSLFLSLSLSRVITSDCHYSPLPPTSHLGIGRIPILLFPPPPPPPPPHSAKPECWNLQVSFFLKYWLERSCRHRWRKHNIALLRRNSVTLRIRSREDGTDRQREIAKNTHTRMMVYYRVSSSSSFEVTRTCRCRWISRKAWLAFYFPFHQSFFVFFLCCGLSKWERQMREREKERDLSYVW